MAYYVSSTIWPRRIADKSGEARIRCLHRLYAGRLSSGVIAKVLVRRTLQKIRMGLCPPVRFDAIGVAIGNSSSGLLAGRKSAQVLQHAFGVDKLALVPLYVASDHALLLTNSVLLTLKILVEALMVLVFPAGA